MMSNTVSALAWHRVMLAGVLALVFGIGAVASAAADRVPRSNPEAPVSVQDNSSRPARDGGSSQPAPADTTESQPVTTPEPVDATDSGADRPARTVVTSDGAVIDTDSARAPRTGSDTATTDTSTDRPARGSTTASSDSNTSSGSDTPAQSSGGYDGQVCSDGESQQLLTLINDYRAANGVGPLTLSGTLSTAADTHSTVMADDNYFSHNVAGVGTWSDNITESGYTSAGRAENIAAGHTSAEETFEQWVNSPEHRENMLNPDYTAIGIGEASNPNSDYGTYWTTTFGDTVDAPAC